MKVLFSGVGDCKVYEIIEVDQVPPEGATINFSSVQDEGVEWIVRTVVWVPKQIEYQAYCVVY